MPASTCVITSFQFTAARSAALRGSYAMNRAMYVCASRDRSLFVSASPGIHPTVGSVKFAVSEIAIDALSISIAAAMTSLLRRDSVGATSVSTSVFSSTITALSYSSAR